MKKPSSEQARLCRQKDDEDSSRDHSDEEGRTSLTSSTTTTTTTTTTSTSLILSILVITLGGLYLGLQIGAIGSMLVYHEMAYNCSNYRGPEACNNAGGEVVVGKSEKRWCSWQIGLPPWVPANATKKKKNTTKKNCSSTTKHYEYCGFVDRGPGSGSSTSSSSHDGRSVSTCHLDITALHRAGLTLVSSSSSLLPACSLRGDGHCRTKTINAAINSSNSTHHQHHIDVCAHDPTWTPTQTGLFVALPCLPILPFFYTRLLKWCGGGSGCAGGHHRIIMLLGVFALCGPLVGHVGFALNSYPLLLVSRILTGSATGFSCLECPTFVGLYTPKQHRQTVAALFQVATTAGIAVIAGFAFGMEGVIDWGSSSSSDGSGSPRSNGVDGGSGGITVSPAQILQCITGIITVSALALMAVGVAVWKKLPPPPQLPEEEQKHNHQHSLLSVQQQQQGGKPDAEQFPLIPSNSSSSSVAVSHSTTREHLLATPTPTPLWKQFAVAIVLPFTQQFTGINAMISYAPYIAVTMGFSPLGGSLLVMVWNFLTSLVAIPLNKRIGFRKGYLFGVAGTVVANVLMIVALLPIVPFGGDDSGGGGGGDSSSASSFSGRYLCAGLAALIFISAFELGVGITYYPLASRAVEQPRQDVGMMVVIVTEGFMSFTTNFVFPVAAASSSSTTGGDWGQVEIFAVFALSGVIGGGFLARAMRPSLDYR